MYVPASVLRHSSCSLPSLSSPGAYFAAQLGIGLKLKDSAARHFLFDLLGLLERIKTDLGANDAVHDEAASAAYIENFALRVFANADAEDRKGNSTRCACRPASHPPSSRGPPPAPLPP